MSDMPATIRLDPADNVVVARRDIAMGEHIAAEGITALQDVPSGHKIAALTIARGAPVLKYATTIGFAGADCPPGTYMHAHNVLMDDVQKDYRFGQDYRPADLLPPDRRADWAALVHRATAPGGRLAVLVFPADKPVSEGGPPHRTTVEGIAALLGPDFRLVTDEPLTRPIATRAWAERWATFEKIGG